MRTQFESLCKCLLRDDDMRVKSPHKCLQICMQYTCGILVTELLCRDHAWGLLKDDCKTFVSQKNDISFLENHRFRVRKILKMYAIYATNTLCGICSACDILSIELLWTDL